jgi:ABC-type phosphate/phosphonate transport system substrate-binding protein
MKWSLALTALLATMAVTLPVLPGAANDKGEPDPVRIGMVQTLFADVPTPLVNLVTPTFKSLMKDFTGLNGDPNAGGDAFEIGKKLMEDKLHIGVLHGVEFAWLAQKYPDIKPLMIAVSKYHSLKAHVIIKGDCPCADFADLKGKDFAVPFRAREHLRLYVEKNCHLCGQCEPKSFFNQLTKAASAEAALDDVLAGKLCATVVDTLAWENYRDVKPGCYQRLKTLKESEPFPTAVVVYRQGALSDKTLEKFLKGMINANKNERGRDLMTLWKLTGFEAVPADYIAKCAEIMKSYPPPLQATTVSRPVSGDK